MIKGPAWSEKPHRKDKAPKFRETISRDIRCPLNRETTKSAPEIH